MNNFTMKKYFGGLCKAHYIAYEELKRLKMEENKLRAEGASVDDLTDNLFDRHFWLQKLQYSMHDIAKILIEFNKKEKSLIITCNEEAIALIGFLGRFPLTEFIALNVDEVFPEDEISQQFLRIFRSKDEEEMHKLYNEMYFEKIC